MQVLSLVDVEKKDSPLAYRNEYKAHVVFINSREQGQECRKSLVFVIERDPLGGRDIQVRFPDEVLDYPVLDLIRQIKRIILDMDDKVQLP